MSTWPGFRGEEHHFWDASITLGDDCLPEYSDASFSERRNPVVVEQVIRRVLGFGHFMIQVLGDLVRSGKTLHDLYPRLVEGPEQSYSGWMLNDHAEFWNALCYLTAPEENRYHYWEESAFFLQLCAVSCTLKEAHQSLLEQAPMCMGQEVDKATGQEDYPVTLTDENGEEYHEVFRSIEEWYEYFVGSRLDAEYDRIDRGGE